MPTQYRLEFDMRGSGFTVNERAGEALGNHKLVYRGADSLWYLADADAAATMPVLGITMGAIPANRKGEILRQGYIGDVSWTWVVPNEIYASTVAGELTQTAPTGVGDIVQVVALPVSQTMIYFNSDLGNRGTFYSLLLEGETAFVGFDPLKNIFTNYWYCDGTADDVQIQAAVDYVDALGGGTVLLERGTFALASGITVDASNVNLEGNGIDATILNYPSGTDVIITVGNGGVLVDNVNLRNFSIVGNALSSHGVLYDLVGTDSYEIAQISVVSCGGDGIHVEDNTYSLTLRHVFCRANGGNGITLYNRVNNCTIIGGRTRGNTGHGLYIYNCGGVNVYGLNSQTNTGNGVLLDANGAGESSGCSFHGLWLEENNLSNFLSQNASGQIKGITITGGLFTNSTTGYGIELDDILEGSIVGVRTGETDNNSGGILLDTNTWDIAVIGSRCNDGLTNNGTGNYTRKVRNYGRQEIFMEVSDPDATLGDHPIVQMPDNATTPIYFQIYLPEDFRAVIDASVIVVQTATGGNPNLRWGATTDWGNLGSEAYNASTDAIGGTSTAVTQNILTEIPVTAAFTGVAGNDLIGLIFTRYGGNVNDTINADAYCLGLRLRYE